MKRRKFLAFLPLPAFLPFVGKVKAFPASLQMPLPDVPVIKNVGKRGGSMADSIGNLKHRFELSRDSNGLITSIKLQDRLNQRRSDVLKSLVKHEA
ncbi:MAG: hypothetical protein HKO64_02665 [Xanthomonadales bacterium]|nr:hypothetical protein [Xanthomonadales bacterium]